MGMAQVVHKFKVGDELYCTCGSEHCKPFTVTEITESVIIGVDTDGDECCYTSDDLYGLRFLTKLQKVLK